MADTNADPNAQGWKTLADVFGWTAFALWSISFYPQVWTNWKRKAVTGLSFDFELYNILGFTYMLIYNGVFYWSVTAQQQYAARNGEGNSPNIAPNDVAFAIHAVVLTGIHLIQIGIYERGNQKFSNFSVTQVTVFMAISYIWAFIAASGGTEIFYLLYYCSYVKLYLTLVKYCSQLYLNWHRKSTVGWNILNVLLDISGALLSLGQLLINCWTSDDWSAITDGGNVLKFGLSILVIFFDVLFILQHYLFYPDRSDPIADYKKVEGDNDLPSSALLPSTNESMTSFAADKHASASSKLRHYAAAFFSQEKSGALF